LHETDNAYCAAATDSVAFLPGMLRQASFGLGFDHLATSNVTDPLCTTFLRSISISQTRGNSLKLNKRHLASKRDAAIFHNRIINLWNAH